MVVDRLKLGSHHYPMFLLMTQPQYLINDYKRGACMGNFQKKVTQKKLMAYFESWQNVPMVLQGHKWYQPIRQPKPSVGLECKSL